LRVLVMAGKSVETCRRKSDFTGIIRHAHQNLAWNAL